jgi:hypothetical protein
VCYLKKENIQIQVTDVNCKLLMNIKNLLYHGKLCFLFLIVSISNGQTIANYIANGGFEQFHNCSPPYFGSLAKHWMSIDSGLSYSGEYANFCNGAVPNQPNTIFQYPKSGNAFLLTTIFCDPSVCPTVQRAYIKNRMKAKLVNGKTYCVKIHVNVANSSPYGLDGFGAYFGDNTIDTITKSNIPLTYLAPQVQNPTGNIITDTLGWVAVTGTFVATGLEKYCLLGNFKSDLATNIATINPTYLPQKWTDLCIDDVSCIPIDLPAYAGPDVFGIPGNTVYIGRPQDVGIDEACTWYNITNTTTPIANAAGITVTVGVSSQTYIVKQDICGNIKYDTVAVYASAVGNKELQIADYKLQIYPNPAKDLLYVEVSHASTPLSVTSDISLSLTNALGQVIKEEVLRELQKPIEINVKDLQEGIYFLQIKSEGKILVNKKFVKEK